MAAKTEEQKEAYKQYKKYIASKEFAVIREAVLNRDGRRCVCCGATEEERTLQAHHKTYEHLYDEANHLSDLSTICQICHLAIHRAPSNYNRFKALYEIKRDK